MGSKEREFYVEQLNTIDARVKKINSYFEEYLSEKQWARICNYSHKIEIGFYRFLPIIGTVYSIQQCRKKWPHQKAEN